MTMTTSGYLRTLAWSRTALLGAAFSLGAFFACPALAWTPVGHVWNGAAGDNNLDNAANWVTNKTNGGFSTTKFKVDHRDAHGNVVGIDLEVAYEKGLRLFLR